jgi:hypothetical protein
LINPGAEIVVKPTEEQTKALFYVLRSWDSEVYLDFTHPEKGFTIASFEFPNITRDDLDQAIASVFG